MISVILKKCRLWVYIFTLLIIFSESIFAKDSVMPTYSDGKSWVMRTVYTLDSDDHPYDEYTLTVCGDSVVDGKKCKKVLYVHNDYESILLKYDEGGITYAYTGDEFLPETDFNLKEGDFLDTGFRITRCDTVTIEGIERKRITIGKDENCYYWVEGIGANTTFAYIGPFEYPTNGSYKIMMKCYENGNLIFSKDDFSKSDRSSMNLLEESKNENYHIFNLNGLETKSLQKGNIYIINGKKVLLEY